MHPSESIYNDVGNLGEIVTFGSLLYLLFYGSTSTLSQHGQFNVLLPLMSHL